MRGNESRVRAFYHALGPRRDEWVARSRYYYATLQKLLQFIVPPNQRVLDIGCGNGDLLAGVQTSRGVLISLFWVVKPNGTIQRKESAPYLRANQSRKTPPTASVAC